MIILIKLSYYFSLVTHPGASLAFAWTGPGWGSNASGLEESALSWYASICVSIAAVLSPVAC